MIQRLEIQQVQEVKNSASAVPAGDWNSLWQASGDAMPLARRECLEQCVRLSNARELLLVAGGESTGELVIGLPLVRQRWRKCLTVHRLPNSPWLQGGALLTNRDRLTADSFSWLAEQVQALPGCLVYLDWIYETVEVRRLIEALQTRGCVVKRKKQFDTGLVQIAGSWEDYLAGRSRGFRKKLNRSLRKIGELGEVEFERINRFSNPDILASCLDDALAIEQRSWKGRENSSLRSNPQIEQLFRTVLQYCGDEGLLEIQFLKVAGQRVAFEIGFVSHETYYSYKISYDPDYASYSPGQLLMYFQLQHWFESGEVRTVDTVGMISEATRKWCNEVRTRYRYLISTGGPVSHLALCAAARARQLVKKILRR